MILKRDIRAGQMIRAIAVCGVALAGMVFSLLAFGDSYLGRESSLRRVTTEEWLRELKPPYASNDLVHLINSLVGRPVPYLEIDKIYAEETRNEQWASGWEAKIREAAKAFPSIVLVSGDCKASLCRYTIDEKNSEVVDFNFFVARFKRQIGPADSQVIVFSHRIADVPRFTMRVFSADPQAAYVAGLGEIIPH